MSTQSPRSTQLSTTWRLSWFIILTSAFFAWLSSSAKLLKELSDRRLPVVSQLCHILGSNSPGMRILMQPVCESHQDIDTLACWPQILISFPHYCLLPQWYLVLRFHLKPCVLRALLLIPTSAVSSQQEKQDVVIRQSPKRKSFTIFQGERSF